MNIPTVTRLTTPSRVVLVLLTAIMSLPLKNASAATVNWDTSQPTPGLGGTGTWANAGSAFWNSSGSGSPGGTFTAWNNANLDIAAFGGSGGTVTISGSVVASQIQFTAGGYNLTGGILSSSSLASGSVFMNYAASGSGTNTVSSDIALNVAGVGANNNYYIRNQSASELVISGDIVVATTGSGNNLVSLQQNDALGKITLSGAVSSSGGALVGLGFGVASSSPSGAVYVVSSANSLSAPSSVGQGTVLIENNDAFSGSSSIAVGTSAATAGQTASLLTNGAYTITQAISLAAGTGVSNLGRVVGGNSAHNSEFTGAVTFANGSTTIQLTAASGGRVDFSGLISDGSVSGTVEKIGAGVVRLTRAAGNTYDGTTTVKAGTLLLMNTSGSATGTAGVTVKAGATLGGTGFSTGLVTADGAAGASRFAPGDTGAIGTLNLSGGLTASTGATFDFDIDGSSIDKIALGSAALTLNGPVTFNFTSVGAVVTATPYTLFTGTGTWTGVDGGGLAFSFVAPTGYSLDTSYGGGNGYVWNTATRDFSVQFAAIPEPSTYAATFGALTLAFAAIRRRRRVG